MNQFLRKYAMPTTNEGRMESMNQLLKKCALLAGCAALALCFTTRSAYAQAAVAAGGTGEHLIFGYWSTENYTDTLVAINSSLGVRNSGETLNVIHVVVRDMMGEAKAGFNACLMPGDSWTAVLSGGNLMVADPGGCDSAVNPPASSSGRSGGDTMMATPASGEMVALGATSGYFEAWLNPTGTLADDTLPCTGDDSPADGIIDDGICMGLPVGSTDPDLLPEDATPSNISGIAMLVSPMAGFSSSYNATALTGCMVADDANGCWVVDAAMDGAPITAALGSMNSDLLTGRWTAISDMNITSHTKVVLTFPVNPLNYSGMMTNEEGNDVEVEGTDPVSVWAFNDMGQVVGRGSAMLGMSVNMCMFDMGDGMDRGDDMPMISCNGEMVSELHGMAGGFRISNNVAAVANDTVTEFNAGTEGTGFELTDDATTDVNENGQTPAAQLNAIGMIFSYFMGTDGNQYDQVTSVQRIDLNADTTPGTSDDL